MKRVSACLVFALASAAVALGAEAVKSVPAAVLSLPSGNPFTIPVTSSLSGAIVPVGKGNVVARRVIPKMDRGDLVLTVYALLGERQEGDAGLSCEAAKSWSRQEKVGTYRIGEGDSLVLSDLERYALSPMPAKFVLASLGGWL
jgi:hypothetical protein